MRLIEPSVGSRFVLSECDRSRPCELQLRVETRRDKDGIPYEWAGELRDREHFIGARRELQAA